MAQSKAAAPKTRHTIHNRPITAPEDRVRFEVYDPSVPLGATEARVDETVVQAAARGRHVYSEILLQGQRFDPPAWVVWGIRYRGWTLHKTQMSGKKESVSGRS